MFTIIAIGVYPTPIVRLITDNEAGRVICEVGHDLLLKEDIEAAAKQLAVTTDTTYTQIKEPNPGSERACSILSDYKTARIEVCAKKGTVVSGMNVNMTAQSILLYCKPERYGVSNGWVGGYANYTWGKITIH